MELRRIFGRVVKIRRKSALLRCRIIILISIFIIFALTVLESFRRPRTFSRNLHDITSVFLADRLTEGHTKPEGILFSNNDDEKQERFIQKGKTLNVAYVSKRKTKAGSKTPFGSVQQEETRSDSKKASQTRRQVLGKDEVPYTYYQEGVMFNHEGRSHVINETVTVSRVHSFSDVSRLAASKFADPLHENIFLATSPAMAWQDDHIVTVFRIWLRRELYYFNNVKAPENVFQDNHLFTQKFDEYFRPLDNGSLVGVATGIDRNYGDGPRGPRLFKFNNKLYFTFYAGLNFKNNVIRDSTMMWDYQDNSLIPLAISGIGGLRSPSGESHAIREKHWSALVSNDTLHFVYTVDPLRILKYNGKGKCKFSYLQDSFNDDMLFNDKKHHIRGGTPYELYQWPYYISVVHSTLFALTHKGSKHYTAHVNVLCVKTNRIIYTSGPIQAHAMVFKHFKITRPWLTKLDFIFPVGLIIEDKDSILMSVHINDRGSVVLRLRGLKAIMSTVVARERRVKDKRAPPSGTINNYIHESVSLTTGMQFLND